MQRKHDGSTPYFILDWEYWLVDWELLEPIMQQLHSFFLFCCCDDNSTRAIFKPSYVSKYMQRTLGATINIHYSLFQFKPQCNSVDDCLNPGNVAMINEKSNKSVLVSNGVNRLVSLRSIFVPRREKKKFVTVNLA